MRRPRQLSPANQSRPRSTFQKGLFRSFSAHFVGGKSGYCLFATESTILDGRPISTGFNNRTNHGSTCGGIDRTDLPGADAGRCNLVASQYTLSLCGRLGRYASIYPETDGAGTINDVVRTPNFDALARRGVLFRNAHVNAPSCTPCRSSLLSVNTFGALVEEPSSAARCGIARFPRTHCSCEMRATTSARVTKYGVLERPAMRPMAVRSTHTRKPVVESTIFRRT